MTSSVFHTQKPIITKYCQTKWEHIQIDGKTDTRPIHWEEKLRNQNKNRITKQHIHNDVFMCIQWLFSLIDIHFCWIFTSSQCALLSNNNNNDDDYGGYDENNAKSIQASFWIDIVKLKKRPKMSTTQ